MPTHPAGLAESEGAALAVPILRCWDDFLTVVDSVDPKDLAKPSRLRGLSGRDVLVHLGTWDDFEVLDGLVAAARTGDQSAAASPEDINRDLLARHTDATVEDVRAALDRSRADIAAWFDGSGPDEVGRKIVSSTVGRLPLLTVLHAGCYELAVHALDLGPCGADTPSQHLLDRGVAALIDVTGALSAAKKITMSLTAQSPEGSWAFASTTDGWTTTPSSGPFTGAGVKASAADLLDASAGRAQLPTLLLKGRLKVQDMAGFLRLAPMVNDVPGLPGGPVLRAGINALNGVSGGFSKALSRFRR